MFDNCKLLQMLFGSFNTNHNENDEPWLKHKQMSTQCANQPSTTTELEDNTKPSGHDF